jgi:hypothetical protein
MRRFAAVLAVGLLLVTAGCLGGGNGEPTPTADPTVTATGTVTAAPTTTTTPEPTDTAAPTTTDAPAPDPTVSVQSVPDTVRDGTATVEVRIENHGGAGAIPWTLQLDRAEGEFYDTSWNGTVEVGPNGIATRSVAIDFRATGAYQLLIDGHRVGTVAVRGLGHTGGGESDAEPAPPVIDVSVSGESVVG